MRKIFAAAVALILSAVAFAQTKMYVTTTDGEREVYYLNEIDSIYVDDKPESGKIEYVDLGLPSGLLWATRNVGATAADDPGIYVAHGETQSKSIYDFSTYLHEYGLSFEDEGDCFMYTPFRGMADISGTKYDAATVHMGGDWRMPLNEEFAELVANCDFKYDEATSTMVGIGPNGNSIILPASGCVTPMGGLISKDTVFLRTATIEQSMYMSGNVYTFNPKEEITKVVYYAPLGMPVRGVMSGSKLCIAMKNGTKVVYRSELIDRMEYSKDVESVSTMIGDYEYVDLGLSSGTKWAKCNLGAKTETDFGGHYAWGETATKSSYTWNNHMKEFGATIYQDASTFTIYCGEDEDPSYGIDDIAGTKYDAATANMGEGWQMPSKADFDELTSECKVEWLRYGDVMGFEFTGPNGNTIFLPAAGAYSDRLMGANAAWFYNTSSIYSGAIGTRAYIHIMTNSGTSIAAPAASRESGRSVRAVAK